MNREQIALANTLSRVLLDIRKLGYEGRKSGMNRENSELIADLADAVHNIPEALMSEEYDLNFQLEVMLGSFDEKYRDVECAKLLDRYQAALNDINHNQKYNGK